MPPIRVPVFPKRDFVITAFGAKPGGEIDNTEAIRKAVAACHKAGGGRVVIPAGLWLTGAVHLKSNVNLHLSEGAVLSFSDNRTLVPTYEERLTSIRGITVRDVKVGRTATPFRILGDEREPVRDVFLSDITIGTVRGQRNRYENARNVKESRTPHRDVHRGTRPGEQEQIGACSPHRPSRGISTGPVSSEDKLLIMQSVPQPGAYHSNRPVKNMKVTANRIFRVKPVLFILLGFLTIVLSLSARVPGQGKRPLRILLVTGGCCHNYGFQTEAIKASLPASLPAEWTVVNEGGTGTTAMIPLYDKADWAKGYDLVIHNECFADTKDPEYIRRITAAHHEGVNAVVIHCAMHSYRAAGVDDWREFLGVTSRRHDHQSRYPVKVVAPKHKVLSGVPAEWTGPKDELYIIEKVWPRTTVLAVSTSERDGKTHPVAWTNRYGKARVFGTTFGHSDEMFKNPIFIRLLGNGIRWAATG